ncbi:MAG: hypothetical protein HY827_01385 [Actinobacteria bacterium]|nr:hypothetical protein [Actinomycetota bacterium]
MLSAVSLLLLIGATLALAAASDLDTSFGTGGKVVTAVSSGQEHLSAVAVQPDGKIIVAGNSETGSGYQFALTRYNPNGTPDTSFDTDGTLLKTVGATNDTIAAIALQPDGKIVVVGSRHNGSDPDFVVARFNPDGSSDTGFSGDGVQFTPIGSSTDIAFDVALQPDGKIVVAGQRYNAGFNDMAVARYNTDGSLDTSFDTDGKVVVPVVADNDLALALALQPDGKIVLTGPATVGGFRDFAFVRLNSNGSLDTGFDGDGILVMSIGAGDDYPRGLIAQPDGKLLTVGEAYIGSTYDLALARLNPDGTLDTGFDGDGKVTTAIGSAGDFGQDVRLQWNGQIVALGATYDGGYYDTAVTRYNSDGSLDSTFDGDGKLVSSISSGSDFGYALAIQPDGKFVAAGDALAGPGNYDFAVQRFVGDPPPVTAPPPTPTASITSPSKSILRRKKLKSFAGTAGPAGQVAKVEIGLLQVNRRLRKRGYCRWLKSNKAIFKKVRDRAKKCNEPRLLTAAGSDAWSFKLKRLLAKGSYKLYVRVTLTNGAVHSTYSSRQGNFKSFTVK